MAEPVSDAIARNRWIVLSAMRAAGVAMVVVGILIVNGAIPAPDVAGYVLVAVGIIDTFIVPQVLARKWRSPKD